MKMNHKEFARILAVAVVFALPTSLFAQARRSTASSGPGPVPEILKKDLKIVHAQIQTPEYDVNTTEPKSSRRNWAVITVAYETLPDWVDELEFRYYVVVQNKKSNQYTLFPLNVSYVEIPKGKHTATVFLRPNTIARYGAIERAGVEVFFRGGLLARESFPASDQRWWESPNVARVEGVLLPRAQTPFVFVSPDNYEMEKNVPIR